NQSSDKSKSSHKCRPDCMRVRVQAGGPPPLFAALCPSRASSQMGDAHMRDAERIHSCMRPLKLHACVMRENNNE
ncbi:MAG: hypothetical protein ACK55Z_04790, partial [bacterium]